MEKNAKLRPFLVAKIIFERTDEDNYLTIAQILDILKKEYGIESYRKTIQADIDTLIAFGFDIQETKSTQNRYNLVSRLFDTAELKLLIDAVESAKVIPAGKSQNLVAKISTLAGEHGASALRRNIRCEGRIRSGNEKILIIIDAVNEAINAHKKISFQYFKYNAQKEKQLKHDGCAYVITPLHLVWNGDHYYIVGLRDTREIVCFRVDRIAGCPRILEACGDPAPEGFDIDRFINTTFRMFSSEHEQVVLSCDNDVMDAIIDRFGENVVTHTHSAASFQADVSVTASHIFFSWVFGFGGKVRILKPQHVRQEYQQMLQKAMQRL